MNSINCQPIFDRLTHVLLKTKLLTTFFNKSSTEDKISFFLSLHSVEYGGCVMDIKGEIDNLFEALEGEISKHTKCDATSEEFKQKGSKAYIKKKDKQALSLYTDGLRYCSQDSPICSLLYANRSAVHFQMKNYQECLNDIDRAERFGYPAEMLHKLLRRKASCLIKLGKKDSALHVIALAKKSLDNVPSEFKSKYHSCIEKLNEEFNETKTSFPSHIHEEILPELFMGESKEVGYMSSALVMRQNNDEGRHIISKTKIPKGSVIFCEKPFASILLPDYFLTHCQHCLDFVKNPIPCDNCIDVLWCNEKCREAGKVYHFYECQMLHILTGVGIAHLAMRILLVAGWNKCFKIRKSKNVSSEKKQNFAIFNTPDDWASYKAVYSLLTHLDKVAPEDYVQYCMASILLSKCILNQHSFFSDHSSDRKTRLQDPTERLIQVSSILVHHIAQLVSNAHAVTEISCPQEEGKFIDVNISQNRIASAIYPSASLMNHSCKPSIINSFDRGVLIIHSTENIEKHEQIYNSYGLHAFRQERDERQEALKRQYYFECKCFPCTDKEFLKKEASWSGVICPSCRGIAKWKEGTDDLDDREIIRCLECCKVSRPSSYLLNSSSTINNLMESSEESISKGYLMEACSSLQNALKLGINIYSKENFYLNSIRDKLAKVYALSGDYEQCLQLLSLCLKITASRFGEESIEIALELLKYLDILEVSSKEPDKIADERKSIIVKINRIFTTHYGTFWRRYIKFNI